MTTHDTEMIADRLMKTMSLDPVLIIKYIRQEFNNNKSLWHMSDVCYHLVNRCKFNRTTGERRFNYRDENIEVFIYEYHFGFIDHNAAKGTLCKFFYEESERMFMFYSTDKNSHMIYIDESSYKGLAIVQNNVFLAFTDETFEIGVDSRRYSYNGKSRCNNKRVLDRMLRDVIMLDDEDILSVVNQWMSLLRKKNCLHMMIDEIVDVIPRSELYQPWFNEDYPINQLKTKY